jgi:hypothetical protein
MLHIYEGQIPSSIRLTRQRRKKSVVCGFCVNRYGPEMKFRPNSTTSERQLFDAMAGGGRAVMLATLTVWRQRGLLPPFASAGLGSGKGRSYFWREELIYARACFVYDALRRRENLDSALLLLWLSGFEVPIAIVRRVWAHRARIRKSWTVVQTETKPLVGMIRRKDRAKTGKQQNILPAETILRDVLLAVIETIAPQDTAALKLRKEVFDRVWRTLRLNSVTKPRAGRPTIERFLILAEAAWSLLERSDLILKATDIEMMIGRRHLATLAEFVNCTGPDNRNMNTQLVPYWSPEMAEGVGAPLFSFIVALVKSGYGSQLDSTATELRALIDHWQSGSNNLERLLRDSSGAKNSAGEALRNIMCVWQSVLERSHFEAGS